MMPAGKIDIGKFRSDVYALMNSVIKDSPSKASNATDRVLAILAFNMKPEGREKPRKCKPTRSSGKSTAKKARPACRLFQKAETPRRTGSRRSGMIRA